MNKNDLEKYKGKKLIFKEVNGCPDIKIKYVNAFEDFKVKESSSRGGATETIRVKVVTAFEDVKLKKVNAFQDFEIFNN